MRTGAPGCTSYATYRVRTSRLRPNTWIAIVDRPTETTLSTHTFVYFAHALANTRSTCMRLTHIPTVHVDEVAVAHRHQQLDSVERERRTL